MIFPFLNKIKLNSLEGYIGVLTPSNLFSKITYECAIKESWPHPLLRLSN